MPRSTPEVAATGACPPWCHANHPDVRKHIQMTDAVLRGPRESVAVEIEQAPDGRPPRIVLSVFTQRVLKAMNAALTVKQARRVYDALGEALRLADETRR